MNDWTFLKNFRLKLYGLIVITVLKLAMKFNVMNLFRNQSILFFEKYIIIYLFYK